MSVKTVLEEVCLNHKSRAAALNSLNLKPEGLAYDLHRLRDNMFNRAPEGEAFRELSPFELALIERAVADHQSGGRLIEVGAGLESILEKLRHNMHSGKPRLNPDVFRAAARIGARYLMERACLAAGVPQDEIIVVLPWRAGLCFSEAALACGITSFGHIGVARDERILVPHVYFEQWPRMDNVRAAIVADPMLATGGTMMDAIEKSISHGINSANIVLLAFISAPEGVDRVLDKHPDVRIVVGAHDEMLNSKGYIVPGLGDFGDMYFESISGENLTAWRERGILDQEAFTALLERMSAIATANDAGLGSAPQISSNAAACG